MSIRWARKYSGGVGLYASTPRLSRSSLSDRKVLEYPSVSLSSSMRASLRMGFASEAGAQATVESVYARYARQVFHWSLRYAAGDSQWAEDLSHDVFEKLV